MFIPFCAIAQSDTIVFRQQLDSVTFRAVPPLVKQQSSGIIINPQSSLLTKGSNALDALERAPGVALDPRNSGISLNGKTGVRILIDGKAVNLPPEQAVSFLEGLSADNIEKIELLTSPPAGMDAEGGAGIINIIRKKNRRQGTSGSATVVAGYGYREKASARMQIAHRNKKINLFGNYAFGFDKTYSDMYIPSAQNMPVYGGRLNVLVFDTARSTQKSHDATAGIDITVSPNTTIGGSFSLNNSDRVTRTRTREDFFIEPDSILLYRGVINTSNLWNNLLQSIYLEKTKNNQTLSVYADHLLFRNTFPSDINTLFTDRHGNIVTPANSAFAPHQRGSADTRIRVGVFRLDYTKPLGKAKLETGAKATWTRSNSESGISGRAETGNNIVMNETIGAAYAGIAIPAGSKTDLKAGARYEYTTTIMDNPVTKERLLKRRGGNLFPNISVMRRINENESYSLSLTKRITRPAYTDLASFIRYSDPTAAYIGNPFLKAAITHNVDIRYTYKDRSLALLLSRDKNPLVRYQITENAERTLLYVSPQNLAWQNNVMFQMVVPVRVKEWWNVSTTITGGWRQFKVVHTMAPVTKGFINWSVNHLQTFMLPKKYSAELSGWFNSKGYNGSVRMGAVGVVNAGLKKELNKSRGVLQLSVSDVFSTMKFTSQYGTITRDAFDVTNKVEFYTETAAKIPVFRLSYTRLFGSSVGKGRSSGSAEENERVNKD